MRLCITMIVVLVGGCSFLAPGYDTRQALLAKNNLVWNADGSASITDETTHNGTTILADGSETGLEITLNQDGVPVVKNATGIFYRKTDPHDAADTYMKLAEQNQMAWSNTMSAMMAMTGQILQYRLASGAQDNSAELARTQARLAAIERLLGTTTQPANQYGADN